MRPVRDGYTVSGWKGTVDFAWSAGDYTGSSDIYEEPQWQANSYTIAFDANGGSGNVPANVSATYDQSHYVAAPTLSKPGYTFDGWATTPGGAKAYEKGGPFKNLTTAVDGTVTLYAHWSPNSYPLVIKPNGPNAADQVLTVTMDSGNNYLFSSSVTYPGYAFTGIYTSSTGGTQVFDSMGRGVKGGAYWSSAGLWCYPGSATLYMQWAPTISADVPVEVTARVDKLGIEEQAPAAGYIESRCGEPLKVTDVSFTPLPGASELFGAGNESQVRLQALAGQGATWQPGGANASFSFSLGASATESDAGKLAALAMGVYGERVPISYRFDVPDALLPTLAEATTAVCQVAYTVALA